MKKTIMGHLLNRWRDERRTARDSAERELYKRAELTNPTKREGHKIEYEVRLGSGGSEIIYAALWKRIDEERIEIKVDVKTEVIKFQEEEEIW